MKKISLIPISIGIGLLAAVLMNNNGDDSNINEPAVQSVKLFLVELHSPDQDFRYPYIKETGCGDHLIAIEKSIFAQNENDTLTTTLSELFNLKNHPEDTSSLYNALDLSDLKVDTVIIENRKTTINLSGSYALTGDCSGSRFVDQIEATVMQFPWVQTSQILIEGKPLEKLADLSPELDGDKINQSSLSSVQWVIQTTKQYDDFTNLPKAERDWQLYRDDLLTFHYPSSWQFINTKASDIELLNLVSIDQNFMGAGLGEAIPLQLFVLVFPSNSYQEQPIKDYMTMEELLPVRTTEIKVNNFGGLMKKYVNSAPEASHEVIYRIVFETKRLSYEFKFNYAVAGCLNLPEMSQKQCFEDMDQHIQQQIKIIQGVLSGLDLM